MTAENGERRHTRPRISIGSIIGFSTLAITLLTGLVIGARWVGGLDQTVAYTWTRVDHVEQNAATFQTEMRQSLQTISQQIVALQILIARQPADATPRRR